MSSDKISPPSTWKSVARNPVVGTVVEPATPAVAHDPRWEYQWEDPLNAVSEAAVEPTLSRRILAEIEHAGDLKRAKFLLFVRGELGIGKSTLAKILLQELKATQLQRTDDIKVQNALARVAILEAKDQELDAEFAKRVNEAVDDNRYTIGLARPATLDAAAQWIKQSPDAIVTMRTFKPGGPLFHDCLDSISDSAGLSQAAKDELNSLASRLPEYLSTPFYFKELANAVTSSAVDLRGLTTLDLLRKSLECTLGKEIFVEIVDCALGKRSPDEIGPITGILDEDRFVHDGYRSLILAVAVIAALISLDILVRSSKNDAPARIAALRLLLDYVKQRTGRDRPDLSLPLIAELRKFVLQDKFSSDVAYPIYMQGLVARTFRDLKDTEPSKILQSRCLSLIDKPVNTVASKVWWDVSDTFALIRDPRLENAKLQHYSQASGYFTRISEMSVVIGSEFSLLREDNAKPVRPYRRASIRVGPLWVARYLVTNELFRKFWSDPQRESFFYATGAQWVQGDNTLISEIEKAFDVAARRCFWKELSERQSVKLSAATAGSIPMLDLARQRALRKSRISLWDPSQADDRFSSDSSPVVGVTWWEAMAFCKWWQSRILPEADFGLGAYVSLLTDWEWEALRRHFYEPSDLPDGPSNIVARYPAHLRLASSSEGRITNVLRPLNVGLAPIPNGEGPYDMVGNVWEWTRSRVFGKITNSDEDNGKFGNTAWDDGNGLAESDISTELRDSTEELNDLSYRAVRGGSFFSKDAQAAWHPAYRLSDPPFSSYFDLGFRIAIYSSSE